MEHECPVCGDGFDSQRGARMHAWDVHDACLHCGMEFGAEDELYSHWLDTHPEEIGDDAHKRAERTVGDRTLCPVCDERFTSDGAVRNHAWEAHNACQFCGETFGDREVLLKHWLAVHPKELGRKSRGTAMEDVGGLSFMDRVRHAGVMNAVGNVEVSRRGLVGMGAVGLAGGFGYLAVSGLLGGGGGDSAGSLGRHPAAAGLGSQPVMGPEPGGGRAIIVAFEDPSCPSCRRFELRTWPRMKEQLVDTGDVSFVYRGIPVVQPWGENAVLALEAVYQRDPGAFWGLKERYYRDLHSISSSNVMDRTRSYLAEMSGVEADAVLDAVGGGESQSAMNADLGASREAGVRGTPTFYLFRGGSYVTELVGPQSLSVFRNALGV